MSAPEGVAPGADAGTGMDSMSKEDLAPGSLAVSNSKVATEEGQRQERIDHAKLQHNKSNTWFLALTALGIVYGDIGTSPLYTFSVALNATGHAEPTPGDVLGIVSLTFWALLATDKIADGARISVLVLLGVIGAALLYGDGVITPAISVLSAMEGLKLVAPSFEHFILPATIVILVGLFMIQRHGTESIGKLFGPVMV